MAPCLEATVTAAAVAGELGGLEVFVNVSRSTVSQMSLLAMTDSLQQRLDWPGEQARNWCGLPWSTPLLTRRSCPQVDAGGPICGPT